MFCLLSLQCLVNFVVFSSDWFCSNLFHCRLPPRVLDFLFMRRRANRGDSSSSSSSSPPPYPPPNPLFLAGCWRIDRGRAAPGTLSGPPETSIFIVFWRFLAVLEAKFEPRCSRMLQNSSRTAQEISKTLPEASNTRQDRFLHDF